MDFASPVNLRREFLRAEGRPVTPFLAMEYFNALPLVDKRKFLWENGRYVLTTDFYGAKVKLFSLNTSFIEVYYHPIERRVMRISIANDADLKKHLSGITVTFSS